VLLAVAVLARLEATLRAPAGDPDARVDHFFDATAGADAGGVLAAMLLLRGDTWRAYCRRAGVCGSHPREAQLVRRRRHRRQAMEQVGRTVRP